YGNWSGWHANQTNSSPSNNAWWNVTVDGIPEGMWKWDAWCNDTINQGDWSQVNRTFTVDLQDPQIGNKYINESGSVSTNTTVCLNVSGVSDNEYVDTVWTTVTQSNGSVFNATMLDDGDCAGGLGDNWYSVNVNVGDSGGTFYYNTTYVNDSSGRVNSNTTVLNLTVVTCDVPTDNDWNISTSCTKQNEVITIAQNKDLNILNSGNLTLINVTLLMDLTADGESAIHVWSGGILNITDNNNDGSLINSTDASYEFAFIVDSGSTFSMTNSQLSECGWGFSAGEQGLEINTTVTEFSGNTLTNNYYGVTFYSDNNIISNNNFSSNDIYGFQLSGGSNNTLTNNTANLNVVSGFHFTSSSDNTLTNNTASSNEVYGFGLSNSPNNTLTNNTASSNELYGFYLSSSSNNTLTNNTASSNELYGFYLSLSSNNTLTNNTASSNDYHGFYLSLSSNNNTLTNNTASSNELHSFYLDSSSDNTLTNNTILVTKNSTTKQQGLYVSGSSLSHYQNNISTSNTINGLPIDYYDGIDRACPNDTALDLSSSYSFIGLVGCNNISVTASNNLDHVLLAYTTNSTVYDINVSFSLYGFYLFSSSNNTLTNNTASSNNVNSFYLSSSNNNILTNNTASSNGMYGFYLSSSNNNTLTNNTANLNKRGIYLWVSDNNGLIQNVVSENLYGLFEKSAENNNYSSNEFIDNINNIMINISSNQTANINDLIEFNISVFYPNSTACSDFTYNITTRPDETVNISTNENNITGNFTVTRQGFYSLIVNVTDNTNNTGKRNYVFLVNVTGTAVVDYYFRDDPPTHGALIDQKFKDTGTLLLTPPVTEEIRTCSSFILASPDDLGVFIPTIIKNINISTWYKIGGTPYLGIKRYATHDFDVDYNQTVPGVPEYTWINRNFSVDWSADYTRAWYWLNLKLVGSGPWWMTNETDPSYVNITYKYTLTPEIKNNTNIDILILSATSPSSDTKNATIYLDGTGLTNLTVQMPNTTITYSAKMDGNDCNDANCNLASQANGELNFSLSLGSEHNITIEGYVPPVASLGTNPVVYYNDSDGSITFDLKCSDDVGVDTLKLYGNWSGWHANQTNSSPGNDAWWNKTVSGIPEGVWKWDAWCNDTGGYEDWSDVNRTFTVDLTNPTASMGTNPVDYLNDSDGSIIFDLKCSDNFAPDVLQLWGNWTGTWEANQTNSTPQNDTWWNVTVSGIAEGSWKWGVYCNDTAGNNDWSDTNRTFTVDLTNPQIGSKYINKSGSVNTDTIVCLNVSGVSDNIGVDTVWTTVTQSNGSVFNTTMSDTGSCAGSPGDNWYSVNVNVGNSTGTFFYNTTYVNDSSGRMNSNTTVLNLTVSACNVDFTMTSQLQAGIRFSEQDPSQVNVSAVDNGDYNVTDSSTSECGTVNVSVRATDDLVNGSFVIGIGNVTVNSTSPGSETIQLSTSYQLMRSGVSAGTSNVTTLYFWLTIPSEQDPRDYNTTIYIMEEME
ncbi:MAG: right-handed parallel beta-helix repeat-containing protein, partial [Candidatus Aenigmarchaeota archaeon]|nr:right-handed parallel beta-helix repeat-containing protein [Candidatus Aenigmarchaeota archaeon]